jgi:GNAT superfamily N-acetyltransferase
MELIRIAEESDYQAVLELEINMSKQNSKGCPEYFKLSMNPVSIEAYNKEIVEGNVHVFEIDKEIIGFYRANVIEMMEEEGMKYQKMYFILSLLLKDEYTGKGYGKKLFQYIEGEAKRKGCKTIELNVWEYNKRAKKFYEKRGMEVKYSSLRKIVT